MRSLDRFSRVTAEGSWRRRKKSQRPAASGMCPARVRIAAGETTKRNSRPCQAMGTTRSARWARERTTMCAAAYSVALRRSSAA
ncbi:hypothetical protein ACIF8W_16850 [Streptomyces sp. NPDC085639]|uniref:hypothetical protein n=1 Tax=Streptomyces sp. NPDC085639 TaxID=3365734 RepID=UPI0037D37694